MLQYRISNKLWLAILVLGVLILVFSIVSSIMKTISGKDKMSIASQDISYKEPGYFEKPAISFTEVYKTSLTLSWTVTPGTINCTVEKSTDSLFSSADKIYSGPGQLIDVTGLSENTVYYFRIKTKDKRGAESNWISKKIKTFYTPKGNLRIATAADLSIDPFINIGDFIIDGWTGGGYNKGPWGYTVDITVPALAPGKKVCILGGRGYDYIGIDMVNNSGSAGKERIITNIGGQVQAKLYVGNCNYVKITGKYDPVAKTGNRNYPGFDALDWSNLHRSFGFHCRGTWDNSTDNNIAIQGNTNNSVFEYLEAGEGGYAGVIIKNDGQVIASPAIPNTGGLNTFTTVSGSVTIATATERLRIGGAWTGGNPYSTKINWIQFVGKNGTYTFQSENNDGTNGTIAATTDAGGGQDVLLPKGYNDYIDFRAVIPPGTYTMNMRVASSSGAQLDIRTASAPMRGIVVRDCYFHDTNHGENMYAGSTQPSPQMALIGFKVYNNLFIRAGLNAMQLGQLKDSCEFNNNVVMCGAFAWSNAFMRYQDQTIQLGARKSAFDFHHNLITGGGENFLNYFMGFGPGDAGSVANVAYIRNNAFLNCRGYYGGYLNTNSFTGTINFNNNIFGRMANGQYNQLYSSAGPKDYVIMIEASNHGKTVLNASNNIYDYSIKPGSFAVKAGDKDDITLTNKDNRRTSSVPYPLFNNFMDLAPTYDYANMEWWTPVWAPRFNPTYEVSGTNSGKPRAYNINDIVMWKGRFYRSKHTDNAGNQPPGNTDAHWQLIIFSNGSTMPPDDVRLAGTDHYARLGMGLRKTVTGKK